MTTNSAYRRNPLPDAEISYWAPKPAPAITARATEPPVLPRQHSEPSRPTPASRQQLAETRMIAQRVHDRSGSSRLELLLRRQQSNRYNYYQSNRQPMTKLEHLAIARGLDQQFQIVIRETQTPFSRHIFKTVGHCTEAAAELEQKFELGGMLEFIDAEVLEHVEAIVFAAVWRERVAVELARSM
jgi:hypothetical protein